MDNKWFNKDAVKSAYLFTTAGFDPADNPYWWYWDPNPVRYLELVSGCGRKWHVPLFCLDGDLHDLLTDLGFDLNGIDLDKDQVLGKDSDPIDDPDSIFWVSFDINHHLDGSEIRTFWGHSSDYYWGSDKRLSQEDLKDLGIYPW